MVTLSPICSSDKAGAWVNPDWRYNRIRFLAKAESKLSPYEDKWVREGVRFLRARAKTSVEKLPELERKFPAIYWAYTIFNDLEMDGPKLYLECLILAGVDKEKITEYIGIDAKVIETYEKLFFDVRRHLNRPGFKLQLLNKLRRRAGDDYDTEVFWKSIALELGEEMLHALWGEGPLDERQQELVDVLFASDMRRKALQTVKGLKPNRYNATEIIRSYRELTAQEKEEKLSAAGGSMQKEVLEALLQSVSFTLAPLDYKNELGIENPAAERELESLLERMRPTRALEAKNAKNVDK